MDVVLGCHPKIDVGIGQVSWRVGFVDGYWLLFLIFLLFWEHWLDRGVLPLVSGWAYGLLLDVRLRHSPKISQ